MENLTKMLREFSSGGKSTQAELDTLIYNQLKKKAKYLMSQERDNHTLSATALVSDAFMKASVSGRGRVAGKKALLLHRLDDYEKDIGRPCKVQNCCQKRQ